MSLGAEILDLLKSARDACAAPAGARRIAEGGAADCLRALVTEIAETLLPRQLDFDLGTGRGLSVVVAEATVVSFENLTPTAPNDAVDALRAAKKPADQVDRLLILLGQFVADGGELSVRSSPAPDAAEIEIECSAQALTASLGKAEKATREPLPETASTPAPTSKTAEPEASAPIHPADAPDMGAAIRAQFARAANVADAAALCDLKGQVQAARGAPALLPIAELAGFMAAQLALCRMNLDCADNAPLLLVMAGGGDLPSFVAASGPEGLVVAGSSNKALDDAIRAMAPERTA